MPQKHLLLSPGCDSSSTMLLRTRFCSPESALVAVMSVFSEMFVKWPLYLSHGPAALMLSVVHLPATWKTIQCLGSSVSAVPCNATPGRKKLPADLD